VERDEASTIAKTGADERTRTSTGLLPQRPERCASAIPPHPHCKTWMN
jgi:hypothetical protein